MESIDPLKSGDTVSLRGKEGKKPAAIDTQFLYSSTSEQTSLANKGQWESINQQDDDVKDRAKEGRRFYYDTLERYRNMDRNKMKENRINYENRYDTRIADKLYDPDLAKKFPSADENTFTIETRVKGYPRACYWNSVNLSKGIIWAEGNYKGRRIKADPSVENIMNSLASAKSLEKLESLYSGSTQKIVEAITAHCKVDKSSEDVHIQVIESLQKLEACHSGSTKEVARTLKVYMEGLRAKEGKYDNEVEPFVIDYRGRKAQVEGTRPSFNSDIIAYQIDFLMEKRNFPKEGFVLKEFHSVDLVNTESVNIMNQLVEKNSTKIFQKGDNEFFELFTTPNVKRTLMMATQKFPNVELSEIEIERKNVDDRISRCSFYFKPKASRDKS